MPNNRKMKDKDEERQPKVFGYILFTKAYYKKKKKNNEELKPFTEKNIHVQKVLSIVANN